MKAESKGRSTADAAQVGAQSAPEPIADPSSTGVTTNNHGPLEPETVQTPSTQEEERAAGERQAVPTASAAAHPRASGAADAPAAPLFEPKDAEDLRTRWNEIQVGFVDEPRTAVERADSLVAETIKRLAESFAAGRQQLEGEWGRGSDASTETLRLTLQRYRSFFNRLLSI